jgi:hypothetical protein
VAQCFCEFVALVGSQISFSLDAHELCSSASDSTPARKRVFGPVALTSPSFSQILTRTLRNSTTVPGSLSGAGYPIWAISPTGTPRQPAATASWCRTVCARRSSPRNQGTRARASAPPAEARALAWARAQISQLPASSDEATAGSTPTTIERDSSGCIRVAALTRKRASAAAAACKASPRSSTPLHGLDEILKTLFSRLIPCDGGLRVVSRESCFRQGCCAVREHRRSHRE